MRCLPPFSILSRYKNWFHIRDQILSWTVFTEAHKAHSLYRNFGRTLSSTLHNTWSQLLEDADNDPNVDNTKMVAHFDECLKEFMAEFLTTED